MMTTTGDLYEAAVAANRTFRSALVAQFGDPSAWGQDYENTPQLWRIDLIAAFALKLAAEERIPPVFLPIQLEEIEP